MSNLTAPRGVRFTCRSRNTRFNLSARILLEISDIEVASCEWGIDPVQDLENIVSLGGEAMVALYSKDDPFLRWIFADRIHFRLHSRHRVAGVIEDDKAYKI